MYLKIRITYAVRVGKIVDVMPINCISCSPGFNLVWIHDSVVLKKFIILETKVSKKKYRESSCQDKEIN